MTDAIKLAIDALEAGLDCAQEVAHRTHEELRGYKPHRHAAVDADVSKIEAALAALRARPASQYLCNGTPFKVAVRNGDAMLPYLPDELGGRWVALVAAEDDCHLRAQPDAPLVFGMRGPKMTFTIENQSFTLDYEPETADEYEFMGNMLKAAISKLPPSVNIGPQPDHSEQHLEMIAAARAVVERWDTPLWKDVPATAVYINRLRDALPAIGETME